MKIKITKTVPVADWVRPKIGEIYEVVRKSANNPKIFFITVKNEEVGIYLRECEVVER